MKRGIMWKLSCLMAKGLTTLTLASATPLWASGTVSTNTEAALNTALTGGGLVYFTGNFTTTLTSTKTIANNTVLDASSANVTINGNDVVRLFNVNPGVTLTILNLKMVRGRSTNGGAIFNNGGTLVATNCVFAFNRVVGGDGAAGNNNGNGGNGVAGVNALGGALWNSSGNFVLNQCSFLTNSATGGNGGNGGNGESTGDTGGNGGAGGEALGGAIHNSGAGIILSSQFRYNQSLGGVAGNGGIGNNANAGDGGPGGKSLGAGIHNTGTLTMTDSDATGNEGRGGNGGDGGTTIVFNGAGADGNGRGGGGAAGAVLYNMGVATVTGSSFSENFVQSGDTGATRQSAERHTGDLGRNSLGGAVCNFGTNAVINCTFYGNGVTGGSGGNGSGDTSIGSGGNGGQGWGGNIFSGRYMMLTNCTVAWGSAIGGSGGASSGEAGSSAGNTGSSRGGNIANSNSVFILHNTVLHYPSAGTNGYSTGTDITDAGFCISSDRSIDLLGPGSRTNTNPMLGPFTTNGGLTMTMAVLPGSPCIDGGDTNFCLAIDQRGNVRPGGGRCDIGAFESIPTVQAFPDRGWASEQGDVGVMTISRTEGTAPLTVYYTLGGTAGNGTDYVSTPSSITIAQDAVAARVIIRPLINDGIEPDETVTLTLLPASNYLIDSLSNTVVTIAEQVVLDPDKRYFRGTGTYPAYHSFVIPLDFQKGVRLADVGGNATNLFPGNPWTTNLYHFDATNAAAQLDTNGRIVFRNPIVAFGSRVGGTPLLVNQVYRFGVYAGANETTNLPQFRLKVYNKTNMAVVNTLNVFIPPEWVSNTWTGFSTNGYSQMVVANGLTTFISRQSDMRWGAASHYSYVLSHKADSTATAYVYEWEAQGAADAGSMVVGNQGTNTYSKLYTFEVESRPPWQAVFIHQPHFTGKPLPPDYLGKSTEELLTASTFLATNPSSSALTWTNLDNSPDLRRHPILDQFVSDLNRDPIALANYVFNEIELTDAFGYDDDGNAAKASVNPGGVNRSALATYQEGQGSPIEQCALLVYLLRQAGYPAAYEFPKDESMKLLDTRLSSILQLQLSGVADDYGRTLTTNRLIAVNYPWVAAYIGTNWVHLFPWMKDTEIVEGFGLYDYMPTNYNNAHKWVRDYLYGKTNLLALSSDDDTPATLFPRFVEQVLLTNAPGLSLDDIGVRVVSRRNNYSRWSDFPKPTSVSRDRDFHRLSVR